MELQAAQPHLEDGSTYRALRPTGKYRSVCEHAEVILLYSGWVFPVCLTGRHRTTWVRI